MSEPSTVERIASLHYARPLPPVSVPGIYGVYYTVKGSPDVYRIHTHRKPKEWKTRAGAMQWASRSLAPSSALARSLGVDAVYVGTVDNPKGWTVRIGGEA